VAITVNPINDAPVNTVPGPQTVLEGGSLVFNTIAIADVDAGTGNLQVTLTVNEGELRLNGFAGGAVPGLTFTVGNGDEDQTMTFTGTATAINNALNGLLYTLDEFSPNFNGQDFLTITTNDLGNIGSGPIVPDSDSVTITVTPVNDAPFALSDAYTYTLSSLPLSVGGSGVLENDFDVDGDPLTAVLVSQPANGAVVLSPAGSFIYTPNPEFVGTDTFTYQANDGSLDSNLATVTITITFPRS
jgi:hypothetical protein